MCQALRELMKDEIARDVALGELRGEKRGEQRGEQRGTILGTVAVYRDEMGLDDQTIINKISSRFNLSGEQAKAYVLPRNM